MTSLLWFRQENFIRAQDLFFTAWDRDLAAIHIQKYWRRALALKGYAKQKKSSKTIQLHTRKLLKHKSDAASKIQKVYRGKRGRVEVAEIRRKRLEGDNLSASKLQAIVRGYFMRRDIFDFKKRKRYLGQLRKENYLSRKRYEVMNARLKDGRKLENEENERQQFEELVPRFHHLLSTSTQPGVYGTRKARSYVVYGRPIEDHLRQTSIHKRTIPHTYKYK